MKPSVAVYKKIQGTVFLLGVIMFIVIVFQNFILMIINEDFYNWIYSISHILFFFGAAIFFYNWLPVWLKSRKLDINKKSHFMQLDYDGKLASLNQKVKKPFKVRKIRFSDIIKAIFRKGGTPKRVTSEMKEAFLNDVQLLQSFLKENPNAIVLTRTHGKMLKIFEDFFAVKKIKDANVNHINWMFVCIHSRGVMMPKPNDFAVYQIQLKDSKTNLK